MYRRILIGVDPQGLVGDAAPAVAALAEPEGAQARLVTVAAHPGRADTAAAADEVLRRLSQELEARHLTVEVERREAGGKTVADAIAASAREFDADLVVLGSHRRGDVAGFFVGSVGQALAARVSTPILVASRGPAEPAGGLRRVLVAVDGGAPSGEAVRAAAALAGPETEVTVAIVDNATVGLGAYPVYVDPTPLEEEHSRVLDDAEKVLRDAGVRASKQRVYSLDGTAAAIARTADDLHADLIVLGSRRPGNIEALLLGSVAHGVIARTRRTVLVATGGPHAEEGNTGPASGDNR